MQAALAGRRLLIITFYTGETLSLNTEEHSPSSLQISTTVGWAEKYTVPSEGKV